MPIATANRNQTTKGVRVERKKDCTRMFQAQLSIFLKTLHRIVGVTEIFLIKDEALKT